MTPNNLLELAGVDAGLDQLIRRNKKARKALKKSSRKLKAALKAKAFTEISILLGMAQTALAKAQFIARTKGTK